MSINRSSSVRKHKFLKPRKYFNEVKITWPNLHQLKTNSKVELNDKTFKLKHYKKFLIEFSLYIVIFVSTFIALIIITK